ncbi:60S ribosomal protein L8 [Ordospora colligata]|uniref:60S ribosomal protein L8 n=1 Tax=Ordospora colligata OC4 TaxID=1354746 RepID=A0A0B2UGI6_9MICR|nr:ribosomal protein L7a [Ordospora colligata OC4]KHN70181.1 ribosomal protein L7a [Ordospora colligata OC4]TBU16725.1 ribosomal protein L7a [Ordospora colligata]TBU17031.1 ribosomal protein L7a [Ordospora colligata]
MVLGKPTIIPVEKAKLTEQEMIEKEILIKKKINKLANAIRIPPAINQFKTFLSEHDTKKVVDLFMKYRPENRAEKKIRLESENPRGGPKPILVKFGLKHVTDLIETNTAKFVLISASVDPIEVVLFLPTLCKKMGIPYAIVENSVILGKFVNMKTSSCVCLCGVRDEDSKTFNDVITMSNAIFFNQYEKHMKTWGGSASLKQQPEND